MNLFLEFGILLIFGILVFLTHKNMMKSKIFESENLIDSVESIDEKFKNFLNNFILKILIRFKILTLQLTNFLEKTIQKINKNATKEDEIS